MKKYVLFTLCILLVSGCFWTTPETQGNTDPFNATAAYLQAQDIEKEFNHTPVENKTIENITQKVEIEQEKKVKAPRKTGGGGGSSSSSSSSNNVEENVQETTPVSTPSTNSFTPWGVGGGGAFSALSMSPFDDQLWFIGTDMGTLFRSINAGESWTPVSHLETTYGYLLDHSALLGFSADNQTIFHAVHGLNAQRSSNKGVNWTSIDFTSERVRYWIGHSFNASTIFAATNDGIHVTYNKGDNWQKLPGVAGESKGSFIDYERNTIYHANASGIFSANLSNISFTAIHTKNLRWFSGAANSTHTTFALIDTNTAACSWAQDCGYVWINNNGTFAQTNQTGGRHIVMAENDPTTIYTIGDRTWPDGYGTKVWVSQDSGETFTLKLHQLNWDVLPFAPWPQDKLEHSAVALDVGWWDDGYYWFTVNRRNSARAGGSENFFVHTTKDTGETWQAPFTQFADTGQRAAGKKWKSTGLEVVSVRKLHYHPNNTQVAFASTMDIGGMKTTDAGNTWQVTRTNYNSNYDYAFDPANTQHVYAAMGTLHDWPYDWYANYNPSAEGGIFLSENLGNNWTRLTPDNVSFRRQFLSVHYDSFTQTIYAGTHNYGVARKTINGSWEWFNNGLVGDHLIVPEFEQNPTTGEMYLLLTGDRPDFSNQNRTGIYKLNGTTWELQRATVNAVDDTLPWYYPATFEIDFVNNIWYLGDLELNPATQWLDSGVWRSTDNGTTWNRTLQLTFTYDITVDPSNRSRVYATGSYALDDGWGQGGSYYSNDYGMTWQKNHEPLHQANMHSVGPDPNDPTKVVYTYQGGAMTQNPRPD